MKSLLLSTCVVAAAVCLASPVCAQTADAPTTDETTQTRTRASSSDQLQDIVVTARRSSESLMQVPVAVTALSAETLVRNNVSGLAGISTIAPFVTIQKAPAGTGGLFIIRGIGSPVGDPGIQQTVLINIDNVLINRGRIVNQGLFDMQQIEVLKGPQALYFGRNSTAGVVSVTTASPGEEFSGYVRGGYEFEADERYVEGAVDIPLAETLAVRLAGRWSKIDGFIKNNARPETNPFTPPGFGLLTGAANPTRDFGDSRAGRATVKWVPTSNFTATLKASYAHDNNGGEANNYIAYCSGGLANPSDVNQFTGIFTPDLQNDCAFGPEMNINRFPVELTTDQMNANNGAEFGKIKTVVSSLALEYIAGDLTINAVTGYYHLANDSSGVFDMTSYSQIYTTFRERADSISQELRATTDFSGPLNFVVGGYYGRDTDKLDLTQYLGLFLGPDPVTGRFYTAGYGYDLTITTKSAFGQLRFKLNDQLEIDAGGRYTSETKHSVDGINYVHTFVAPNFRPAGVPFDRRLTNTNFSPEATVTWKPDPDQTVFASYKTGFKSGGFSYPQIQTASVTDANTRYSPEKSKGFEIGYKGFLFDRLLQIQAAAYRFEFTDLQFSSFNSQTLNFTSGNAGKSRTQGFEIELTARPASGLTINSAFGYNDAKYISFRFAPCKAGQTAAQGCVNGLADLSGQVLPRAPHWQANVSADYAIPVSADAEITFTGRANYTSSYFAQDNLDPGTTQPSYWLFDLGVSVDIMDKVTVGFIAKNLTNEYINVFSFDKALGRPGEYNGVIMRPRQLLATVGYKF